MSQHGINISAVEYTAIKRRGLIPRHFTLRSWMKELSIFCDESGIQEGMSKYYLVTVVLHDQSKALDHAISSYEGSLKVRDLPDIPFHATPLMRAHDAYENMSLERRKQLLVAFNVFVQRLPIQYKSFVFQSKQFKNVKALQTQIRKSLISFLFDEIEYFQSFDKVKIYYDNGQTAVTDALHSAIEYALSTNVPIYKDSDYRKFRLSQAADYLCEIELAAVKYENHDETQTDIKFFGSVGAFKKNYLKQARRKLIQ